jgi:tetratricopeptide (TPR) repeat protein
MKTILTFLISVLFVTANGQSARYEQAMLGAIEKMNNATSIGEFIDAANLFERIGQTEKNEWLPQYYTAYMYLLAGFQEEDITKKDPYFDKAQQFLDNAFKLTQENSELFVLQAFIYPGRMVVDPMNRGMELMGKMNAAIDRAIKLDPENPRSYYLQAVILLNMPVDFGGGPGVAKPLFEKASEKFNKFNPESPISPNWGKEQNEEELSKL